MQEAGMVISVAPRKLAWLLALHPSMVDHHASWEIMDWVVKGIRLFRVAPSKLAWWTTMLPGNYPVKGKKGDRLTGMVVLELQMDENIAVGVI